MTDFDRTSTWEANARPFSFPRLEEDVAVDIAIVGAGITGTTLASELADAGVRVALVDARSVGGNVTRHSTGHLTSLMDAEYHRVAKDFSPEVARLVAESTTAAIDHVERNCERFGIDAGFKRVPATYFTESLEDVDHLRKEFEAARSAGLPVTYENEIRLPFPTAGGIRLENQAWFNPLAYTLGLAESLAERGVQIFENTRVVDISHGDRVVMRTEGGTTISAGRAVLCTHTPLGFDPLQTVLSPYRSYVIGADLSDRDAYPDGLYFDTMEPYNYYRTAEVDGRPILVAGGADHPTGEMKDPNPYGSLEAFVAKRFPVSAIRFRWSAQVFVSADGLPYIGPSALRKNVFVATGLRGDGLLWGTVAGIMLAKLARGEEHPWTPAYDSTRFKPVTSGPSFIKENVENAVHFIADRFKHDAPKLAGIASGEGGIVDVDGSQTAAYRDDEGHLHLLSPVCQHMKCIVSWNSADRTWDCPCHGARYDAKTGEVISGPAMHGLPLLRKTTTE
ncbi:FAD-dependent oxidoreductase [soil metagenome]